MKDGRELDLSAYWAAALAQRAEEMVGFFAPGAQVLWPAYEEHKTLFNGIMTRSEKNMDEFLYEHLTSGYRSALPELLEKYPEYFCV